MVDFFLVLVCIVAFAVLTVAGFYLLVHYQHPDDHNEAWFPKLVVLFGFVLAGATVLLLPLDVANNEGYAGCDGYDTSFCGGLNMEFFWSLIIWLIPIWVFVLIPFSTFYYEADDGMLMAGTRVAPDAKPKSKLMSALCYQLMVFIIVGLIFFILYLAFADTDVPVREYKGESIDKATRFIYRARRNETTQDILPFTIEGLSEWSQDDRAYLIDVQELALDVITLQVQPSYFFAGVMAFFGWFFLAIFGGIGLAAMPLDLVLMYIKRPRHMDAQEFSEAQTSLRERTNELVDIGELIKIEREEKKQLGLTAGWASSLFDTEKRKEARDERNAVLGFKQAVYLLEKDVEDFLACHANWEAYNPLIPYAAFLLGMVSFLITFLWFLHIILYVLPDQPYTPFLNNFFEWFDGWFPLFGVLAVCIFTLYLLLCALIGCFKFGMRCLCVQLHPMKVGKTYMSSFLFNIALVLLCAFPVVQFCQGAFADYARFSTIRQVFGVQVENLKFFRFFWTNKVFVWVFLVIFILSSLYLICRPVDQATNSQALRDRLKSRRA